MVEINFSSRWIDAEEAPYALLLLDLLNEYQAENTCENTKTVMVGIIGDPDDDNPDRKHVTLCIMSFEKWNSFCKWCRIKGVRVSAKKKVIDGLKIWWPSVIEIDADGDNELLVLSKLRHL